MEIEVDQPELLAAVELCERVATRKGIPSLATVLLRASPGRLVCTATDLFVSVADERVVETTSPGALCLDARKFLEVIRTLPAKPLHLVGNENHWARLSVARAQFRLMGYPPDDFPQLPRTRATGVSCPSPELGGLLRRVQQSICTDDARVNLAVVMIHSEGDRVTAVTTDGHRMTRYSKALPFPAGHIHLPRRGLPALLKALDRCPSVHVALAKDHLFVTTEPDNERPRTHLSFKLGEGPFPDHTRIIPSDLDEGLITVQRTDLRASLTRASVLESVDAPTLRITVAASHLRLAGHNPELGETADEVSAESIHGPVPREVRLNARYLLDALDVLDGEAVRINVRDSTMPVTVQGTPEGPLSVIMPMRL